jgi:hypothetical protein
MRNLFILNGATSMMVADSIMRTSLIDDENIVVVENVDPDFSQVEASVADKKNVMPGWEFRRAEELVAQILPTTVRLKTQYSTEWPNFRRRPLAYMSEVRCVVKAAEQVKRQMPAKFDRLFYSGNARLQFALAKCAHRYIRLEHGLGDYMFLTGRVSLATKLRRLFVSAVAGFLEFPPDEIYLSDGGKCRSIPPSIPGVRHINPPDVVGQFSRLMMAMDKEEPGLAEYMRALRARMKDYREVIIYMPLDRFPMEEYDHLLDKQLEHMDTARTLFIVKPHPTDPADYLTLFRKRGLLAEPIEHPVAGFLPVELIAAALPEAKLMGAGSSGLFYGKWWLDRTILYSTVDIEERIPIYRRINTYFAADIAAFVP